MRTLTMVLCAVLSLTVGIACAAPLLVSELSIRPWTIQVAGVKAEFNIDVVYANFTTRKENHAK